MSKDQIARAREVDVLDYVRSHERDNLRRVGGEFRLRDHDSLAVDRGKWYWHSREIGGATALDFLIHVRGYSFTEAVCLLLNEVPLGHVIEPEPRPPPKRAALTLPPRNRDNRRVAAYLQSRGIDKGIIDDCIERGSLYESALYHNCVFVGRDEKGKARFAAMRSTAGSFKRDAAGSDKRFGFIIPPKNPNSNKVAVFEAPIDSLSHQTLCKLGHIPPFDGWRLALGGTSLLALKQFLEAHGNVSHCLVCTDNDEAGNRAAAAIAEIAEIKAVRELPPEGEDWNDVLKSIRNEVKPLEDKRKDIRFVNSDYETLFTVKDGDSIKFTRGFDGEEQILKCRYIDETHLMLIGIHESAYHICEFAEIIEANNSKIEVIPDQPKLNILAAKYGEPLQDVEIPMTKEAISEFSGKVYTTEMIDGDHFLISNTSGVAIFKREDTELTSVHPFWAQKFMREYGTIAPPSKNSLLDLATEKKPSLKDQLDGAKSKAAGHNAANTGVAPKKHDPAERS